MEYSKFDLLNLTLHDLLEVAKKYQINVYTFKSEDDLKKKIISKYIYIYNKNKIILNKMDEIKKYFTEIPKVKCFDCQQEFREVCINTLKTWKGNKVCDHCYSTHNYEINKVWELVKQYKPHKCIFCGLTQNNIDDRFHYDHLNMFDKSNSVCDMIKNGEDIKLIYAELDKCQSVCINCHHKITFIEQKLGFTKAKRALTKAIKENGKEYRLERKKLHNRYEKEMKVVYDNLINIK
jgi:hypothetical protein